MSKALRGDFARLRERGVSATLAPRDERERESDAAVTEPGEETPDADHVEPQPGWLGRLLGR